MKRIRAIVKVAGVIFLLLAGYGVYGISSSPTAHACASIPGYQTFGFDMSRTSNNPSECMITPMVAPTLNWSSPFPAMTLASRDGISTFANRVMLARQTTMLAFPFNSPVLTWSFPTGGAIAGAATAYLGNIYFNANSATFYAVTPAGAPICSQGLGSHIITTPVGAANRLFVTTIDTRLIALDPATCSILGTTPPLGMAISSPSASGSLVFVSVQVSATQSIVMAFDATTLSLVGQTPPMTGLFTTPVLANSRIYVGTNNASASILAFQDVPPFNPVGGNSTGGPVTGKPAVDGSQVYLASGGKLFILNASLSSILSVTASPCGPLSASASPTVANGGVYVGTGLSGCITAFTTAGLPTWSIMPGGTIFSPITVINGWLYAVASSVSGDAVLAYN